MSFTTAVASGRQPADAERGSDRRADVLPAGPGREPHAESVARSAGLPRSRPLLVGEIVLVAFLLFGYDRIASVANAQHDAAMRHGWAQWRLEHLVHIAVELPLNGLIAAHRVLGQVLALYYDFAHALVTFGVLASLYIFRAQLYRPARNALMLLNGVALIIFVLLPVAPPRLLSGAGFVDVVVASHTIGSWEAGNSSVSAHVDRFASVPSLHVAWSVWVLRSVLASSSSRVLRTLASGHVVLTAGLVVVTGNHYIVDVVAGAALAELAWWTARGVVLSVRSLRPCR
jgi:diacylglycerol O-acyltransferase